MQIQLKLWLYFLLYTFFFFWFLMTVLCNWWLLKIELFCCCFFFPCEIGRWNLVDIFMLEIAISALLITYYFFLNSSFFLFVESHFICECVHLVVYVRVMEHWYRVGWRKSNTIMEPNPVNYFVAVACLHLKRYCVTWNRCHNTVFDWFFFS